MNSQLFEEIAWFIAENAHLNQKYANEPYINHVKRVHDMVCKFGNSEDSLAEIVAILHDVVEDSNVSLEEIEEDFGKQISQAVDAMTRRNKESYSDYIKRLSENRLAKIVKVCDLIENLTNSYVNSGYEHLRIRYKSSLVYLITN